MELQRGKRMNTECRWRLMKSFLLSLVMVFLLPFGVQAQADTSLPFILSEQEEEEISIVSCDLTGQTDLDVKAQSGARAAIQEGLKQHAASIDLRAYRLTYDEARALLKDVIYWDGSLFYVEPLASATLSGGYVIELCPRYIEHEAEVEKALKRAVRESITSDMSDIQKMLALHNWLAVNCSYDYTYSNYTVYDALVTGSAVCQGYKDSYEMMLRYVGILEVGTATGGNHTWNQVKVDGHWFNIDVTWDSNAIENAPFGQMYYGNFMISDSQLLKNHTLESQDHACTDTRYDEGGWWNAGGREVCSAAVPVSGAGSYRLGYDGSEMSLIYRTEATGKERVMRVFDNAVWGYRNGNYYEYYPYCFGVLQRVGRTTFLNDTKSVYRITDDGNVSVIYTYEGMDGRNIFGMRVKNGKLELQIGYRPYETEIRTVTLESYIEEEADVTAFVKRLYTVCLGRPYDEKGLNDWVGQLESQTQSAAEVAQGFFFSDEFTQKEYDDSEYLHLLYQTMFDRSADQAGMEEWLDRLENGVSRLYVFRGFAESDEFTNLCDRYDVIRGSVDVTAWRDQNPGATGFIARLYTKMLGRRFDEDGLEDWCRAYLTGEKTIEEIASDGFLHSQELINQNIPDEEFVRRMYQTFLNRQPDSAGFADWVARLKTGEENRDTLVYGFTRSQEFGALKASYGL